MNVLKIDIGRLILLIRSLFTVLKLSWREIIRTAYRSEIKLKGGVS